MPPPRPSQGFVDVAVLCMMVLLAIFNVPWFQIPAPRDAFPFWMVRSERLTWIPEAILMTVLVPPPSIIVIRAPEPIKLRLILIIRFSAYFAPATVIVSPDATNEIAWPIVLHPVITDKQLLLSLPLRPST